MLSKSRATRQNAPAADLAMLGVLDRICIKLEQGEAVPPAHLARIGEFFHVFADTCHHAKEEEFLFPAYEAAGIPRERGPIGAMLTEQQEGRGAISRMKSQLDGVTACQADAVERFILAAWDYTAFLSAHIQKENQVLFPMGDRVLSSDRQQESLREFDRLEETRIGAGKHEEFHRLIETLFDAYPPQAACGGCTACCC
ncbi:MAG TPA: hemerythrin domain-containing protein [Candidatus Ozemobacteraceae bacterium]|nr:hemerythrin domain-containing protein [Candidatus Ozemobacteraceae bacterium]